MPYCEDKKILYIHIPKTGGQSLVKMFGLDKWATGHVNGYSVDHYTAQEARDRLSCFDQYFRFAFVRNPWDRLLSEYFFRRKVGYPAEPDFNEFVLSVHKGGFWKGVRPVNREYKIPPLLVPEQHLAPQSRFILGDAGQSLLDYVGVFETFDSCVREIASKLGITIETAHVNQTDHKHYSEYYSRKSIELVSEMYREDIKMFGYRYSDWKAII